jgi:hypothetical protein
MAFRLSCPSCNTSFALPELPADRRAACPRCGDVFPVRAWEEVAGIGGGNPGVHTPGSPHAARRAAGRWSVRRAVAVALAMGLVGLLAGLGVYYSRDFRSKPQPEPELPPSLAATPPARLAGLGFLPADAGIVFALQPGPALAYAERTKQDPRQLFTKAGLPRQMFDAVANLGLTLPQIDHLAGAASAAELRFTFVLVLRRPLADEDETLKRIKAVRQNGAKERYRVDLAGLPIHLTLARVSPTVWVFGLDEKKDFEAVDRGGYGPGGKQFAPALAAAIAEQVPPDAAAWLAADDERWADKPLVRLALGQLAKKEGVAVLSKGRAAVAALSLDDPPRLRLFVKAVDDATGEQLRAYFAKKAAADEQARHGGAGQLAFFDTPIDPANTFATLQQMLGDAGK